ncbi:uncharacterized protein LOC103374163 [Stegastes partitus]|uniref:Uncharacterized protein LOC103374163 n=1 Tax=Stegastes partitus TaxID=144197 RepID=A0A9Y4U2S1_9TELE|nr:PREDICTED: uncharacterized protein LOC103374163 [Stegastes partitus]
MEDFSRYLGINGTLTLICCIFCIFLPGVKTEWKTVSKVVGSRVTLQCNNTSISTLSQVTWKMNRVNVFTYMFRGQLHTSTEATNLYLNMSKFESQLYELIIESAQTNHTGNYTCETTTDTGVWEQNWRLIIKESTENSDMLTSALPFAVVLLVFVIGFVILIIFCKRNRANSSRPPTAVKSQKTEDVYENCLELERRRHLPHPPLSM